MMKLRQLLAEVAVNLSSAQAKMNDMKAEINHVRSLKENYRILVANCVDTQLKYYYYLLAY
jgi:hypothetical protein